MLRTPSLSDNGNQLRRIWSWFFQIWYSVLSCGYSGSVWSRVHENSRGIDMSTIYETFKLISSNAGDHLWPPEYKIILGKLDKSGKKFYVGFPKSFIGAFPLLTYICLCYWLKVNECWVAWLRAFHFLNCSSTFLAS